MPVYYTTVPVNLIRSKINRNNEVSRVNQLKNSVIKNGFLKPILLDDKFNVILGGTRVQVAFLLKFKGIKSIIFTKKRYKKMYRIKSFEELLEISKLNAHEIHRLNISGKIKRIL